MESIIEILIVAAGFLAGARLLDGVYIKSYMQAIVIALLNVTVGTFLKIVTLGLLSPGIFNWLLSAILIQIADFFLKDFEVKNFWWALGLAAVVSIVSGILRGMF